MPRKPATEKEGEIGGAPLSFTPSREDEERRSRRSRRFESMMTRGDFYRHCETTILLFVVVWAK